MNLLISLSALCIVLFSLVPAHAETARIVLKEATLREQCRFLAPSVAKLQYNDSVTIISREGDWVKVSFGKTRGCLHRSALETRSYSVSGVSGTRAGGASQEEVALAGKGFTPEVEASYRRQHSSLNYRAVDGVERYRVSDRSLWEFMRDGGLKQP